MKNKFFLNRSYFWLFWANILFIVGMIGYLFMDIDDYIHTHIFSLSITNTIYIILAIIFVINSTVQFFVIYYMNKHAHRYYAMMISCIFDKIGSHAYLLGTIFTVINYSKIHTIWTLNTLGVCAFVIGATINLMIPPTSCMSICADYMNLLGSLIYLLAIIITRVPLTQMLVIIGDFVYLIDSFLYMICWFQDREYQVGHDNLYVLLK